MEAIRAVVILLLTLFLGATFGYAEEAIKQIEINGLKYSDARVVLRELPFVEGDIWQPEFAAEGEKRLRNLGLFSEANIQPPDANGVVHISVNDKWPIWLLPEVTRSDRGSSSAGATFTYYNMWGLNHQLRLATKWDTGTNFTANNGNSNEFSYNWRRVNDSKVSLDVSNVRGRTLYDAYQNGVLTSTYILQQQSWTAGISYGFGPVPGEGWDARIGFISNASSYTLNSGPQLPDIIGVRRQGLQVSADYRMIDDRITWLTGTLFDYTFNITHKALGSQINTYKHEASFRQHIKYSGQNTLSYRINAGFETGDLLRDDLFDIGNGNSIRGYYPGELQGDAYLYGTLEGRFPLEINSNVQLVAFSDIGHISRNGSPALGRTIVAGLGAGVRWTFRWLVNGTIRLDGAYGTATHRWRAHLGTGQAF